MIKTIYVPAEQRNSQISEEKYRSIQKTVLEGCYMMVKSFLSIPHSEVPELADIVLKNREAKVNRSKIVKLFNAEGKQLFDSLKKLPLFADTPKDL